MFTWFKKTLFSAHNGEQGDNGYVMVSALFLRILALVFFTACYWSFIFPCSMPGKDLCGSSGIRY
ncbi:MAG: hypothetical protein QNL62_16540 [Gammaproteobacteria bacterium]|nr:hypothetical protein [Gammaproteobacteria bacterium]